MLPKPHRLNLRPERTFFSHSHKKHFPEFSLFYVKAAGLKDGPTQGAVIVSKKNFPLATDRNRIKRQARAVLAPLLAQFTGWQVVVQVKKPLTPEVLQQLKQTVTDTLFTAETSSPLSLTES
jgi:ribonuclease P protein component